ncbi:MAG: nucleotidyltransferase family protein [Chitinophagaceae bacterium]
MNCPIMHLAIIILAAGRSNRLGSPKQLLQYKGKGLLQNTIEVALDANSAPVIVIMGANASIIEAELLSYPVEPVYNEKWEEGMASSIICGLTHAEQTVTDLDGVLLMVCDQPFVDRDLVKNLLDKQKKSGAAITACCYEEITGIPAIFHKSIFPELKMLQGEQGAKNIIRNHKEILETIPFKLGKIDIDTKVDYENLLNVI